MIGGQITAACADLDVGDVVLLTASYLTMKGFIGIVTSADRTLIVVLSNGHRGVYGLGEVSIISKISK